MPRPKGSKNGERKQAPPRVSAKERSARGWSKARREAQAKRQRAIIQSAWDRMSLEERVEQVYLLHEKPNIERFQRMGLSEAEIIEAMERKKDVYRKRIELRHRKTDPSGGDSSADLSG
jgi:hypothetical protein